MRRSIYEFLFLRLHCYGFFDYVLPVIFSLLLIEVVRKELAKPNNIEHTLYDLNVVNKKSIAITKTKKRHPHICTPVDSIEPPWSIQSSPPLLPGSPKSEKADIVLKKMRLPCMMQIVADRGVRVAPGQRACQNAASGPALHNTAQTPTKNRLATAAGPPSLSRCQRCAAIPSQTRC